MMYGSISLSLRGDEMARKLNLFGREFTDLTVTHSYPRQKSEKVKWVCRCKCGKTTVVSTTHLMSGHTRSCRCRIQKVLKEIKTIHGLRRTKIYGIWAGMIQRCGNPNNPNYFRYGGRGIKVCERWQIFVNFFMDMGHKPAGMSIDRVDNDGDYEPTNCKWSTPTEQANNRRDNVTIPW